MLRSTQGWRSSWIDGSHLSSTALSGQSVGRSPGITEKIQCFTLEQHLAQTSIYYTAPGNPYVHPSSNL
jgi:hypothetical protein